MRFVINGGLFISTSTDYEMGEKLSLEIILMNENYSHLITGKVIWKTPPHSGSNKPNGIGVQFINPDGLIVKNKIEAYLTDLSKSDKSTYTL
jgi:type IV pilus assembly protein PilZ